jgi:Mlc titration factor MtfA (ptsG expression regulator)
LKSYIRWFIGSKEFEGCSGLTITDEIRVTIAAHACLLLLHRQTPCYERLRLIRVYPDGGFSHNTAEILSGESWDHGVVVLDWDSVVRGAADPLDGDNVVLHEFAHELDREEGEYDGMPRLGRGMPPVEAAKVYSSWAKMLSKEYDEFRLAVEQGGNTVMDGYGATSPEEFFAVATECFFEKSKQMCERHPGLYAALKQFYRQDPSTWATDVVTKGVNLK